MYRTVFVLKVIEGFSVAETADILAITSVNVEVRLNRAKTLLQTHLKQFYSNSELYSFNLIYCGAIVQKIFEQINAVSGLDPKNF
jgi:RNA polymerase sigma-70 factor (ECF subfamily)